MEFIVKTLLSKGAACNKRPGFSQFPFMVVNPQTNQSQLQTVDCF